MPRITTPFGFEATADDVVAGRDLSGLRVVVTGGASGIGLETARSLARAGADVTIGVRDVDAGQKAAADIEADTGRTVRVAPLDLTDLASVTAFVDAWDGPLNVLINNAGVMAVPDLRRTAYGWELQFATNHLGHFALALGLHDALAAAGGGARIVSVSSSGHRGSPVVFEDVDYEHRPYDPWSAYGQAKTANVLFAVEATRRWAGDGIVANALMPGGIMTNLQRFVPDEIKDGWKGSPSMKSPQQGAATTLVAAIAPEFEGVGGKYLENGSESLVVADDADVAAETTGVRQWALDPAAAERLWDLSARKLRDAGYDVG
ncbi:SDR family NAD(P)-dependent oxidoreductase [Tersicoccus sp. MR15.9]|uniref:SDR family NAD(P)-dependent oxidoreductase n=1 Tax=Tersicoccus mangrovi TaxID=3121635 RepID=UPI002FE684C1